VSDQVRDSPELGAEAPVEVVPADPTAPDTRSPLERFRTQPKKALSVTDLVSPAWCELQYWYTLTHHGRKRRTPAMKQGSKVHQVLEDQVHTTVHVRLETKEDAWGLRIWNVIQGLKTLREEGLTRELEIWGTVDGLVVNGIIDELSYTCPDAQMEESLQKSEPRDELPPDQATISEFFKAAGGTSLAEATRTKRRARTKKVYLCDVKTRGVRNLPSGPAFRPTKIQLMLYHRLLAAIATNNVDFSVLTARYQLDPVKTFSDSFLAQIGGLHESSGQPFLDAKSEQESSQESEPNWSQDSLATLLAHNNLSAIWSLMITEFQLTLPDGADTLGKVLKAEYRSREDGEILGSKTFAMDDVDLSTYINHEMEWWKGERQAEGVVVAEAFKCRSCEFADNCEWRIKKVEEAKEKARMTKKRTAAI
jgi:exonuclease V